MDLHELKNLLEEDRAPKKSQVEIGMLSHAKPHPVLRAVRRQVIIEGVAWTVFLSLVYTAFDADRKPLWVGLPVVMAVSAYLIHLVAGYSRLVSSPADRPLVESLGLAYTRMRRFALRNLLLRTSSLVAVLFFFSYGIDFTPAKYVALVAIAAGFILQLLFNRRLWLGRLRRLRHAIVALTPS